MSKSNLYINAFKNVIDSRIEDEANKRLIKQNVLFGVKVVNSLSKPISYDVAVNNFQLVSAIKAVMQTLTPSEFMNVFPIEKDFKGYKYEMKDYFYTIDYISKLDQDKPIGEEITEFLWEYSNEEINAFTLASIGLLSDIREFEGHKSIAEEWAEMNGVKMRRMYEDDQGKRFLLDSETGKTMKVSKRRPKILRLIK